MELKIQERKELIEGDMPSLREKRKMIKPKSMEGRRLKKPPIKDLAVATKQLASMIKNWFTFIRLIKYNFRYF